MILRGPTGLLGAGAQSAGCGAASLSALASILPVREHPRPLCEKALRHRCRSSTQVFPSFSARESGRDRQRSELTPPALAMLYSWGSVTLSDEPEEQPMVMHLRPYQHLALYHLRRSLEAGACMGRHRAGR